MSWKEKVQQKLEEDKKSKARKIETEREKLAEQKRLVEEALKKLGCEEKLKEIRDEIWEVGEVISGSMAYVPHHYNINREEQYPGVALETIWPGIWWREKTSWGEIVETIPEVIERGEVLAINFYFKDDIFYIQIATKEGVSNLDNWGLGQDKSLVVSENPNIEKELDDYLLQHCIDVGRHVKSKKEEEEQKFIGHLARGEISLDSNSRFNYLLEQADSLRKSFGFPLE